MGFYLRSLLLIVCFCAQKIRAVVYTEPRVTGWIGQSVTLYCESSLAPYAVYWGRVEESDPKGFVKIAQNFNGNRDTYGDRYSMHMNNAVTIEELVVPDEDTYVCQVVTEKGEDSRNTTQLRINAPASRPLIEQCDEPPEEPSSPDIPTVCQTATSSKYPIVMLECNVTGFRPNISLNWYNNGRMINPFVDPTQTKGHNDTYDRVVTISVQAKPNADQNFTCKASGEAVLSETSSAIITVLALPDAYPTAAGSDGGLSAGGLVGIAIISIIAILALIFAVLVVVGVLLRRHNKLPQKGEWALNKIPFLRKVQENPDPEKIRLEHLENQRKKLRERILNYKVGDAAGIKIKRKAKKANINLFGQMSAGKSAFMNSLNFAFTGIWSEVSTEAALDTAGGMTRKRVHHHLSKRINLIDNPGMKNFDKQNMQEILEIVRGERGEDLTKMTKKVDQNKEVAIHCAVFVYRDTDYGRDQALAFINEFNKVLFEYYDRQPLYVLTHKDEVDTEAFKNKLHLYGVSKNNVYVVKNYTQDSHTENIDEDITLLEFLLAALEVCDRNLAKLEKKK